MSRIDDFLQARDPEQMLFEHLRGLTKPAFDCPAYPGAFGPSPWAGGRKLRILLAGYIGAGNVGSEMRSAEIVRHIQFLLGSDNVSFTALVNGPFTSALPTENVTFATLDGYVAEAIVAMADEHDAVVACEGSMLKSSFSNVLSGVMAAGLARAAASGKLAVGYGAEIGSMEPMLEDYVSDTLTDALFLCRNAASLDRARALGLRAQAGADTAWIIEAKPKSDALALLKQLGLSATAPILAVCPTNPFWWPVRPNPSLAAQAETDERLRSLCYDGIFFHTYDERRQARFERYLDALAGATATICRDRGAQPLLVAMDPTDTRACLALQGRLNAAPPILYGYQYPVGLVAAALRCACFLISSRFHALVAAAPAAIPFAGVATDERIANLLGACGAEDSLVAAGAPDLEQQLVGIARRSDAEEVQHATRELVRNEVHAMGRMGAAFTDEVRRRLPGFPISAASSRWDECLPPLPPLVEALLAP